jgi:S-methylmethionine-dependent homocysteine/selenocysteine methylase
MDGGLETTLTFLEGIELPCFAAFPLLLDTDGRRRLESYFEPFIRMALDRKVGFVLDTPTWRSNTDWGAKLGYSMEQLVDVNRRAVVWAIDLKGKFASPTTRIVVNGVVGPRGDGYRVDAKMTAEEARTYHNPQIETFHNAGAEMVSAITMNYVEEAIGIVKAAQASNIPVVISFTVETDGKLASGDTLGAAIETVERATGAAPAYYMVNCAHPTHFDDVLSDHASWTNRVRGLRANASTKSHAELDVATELDAGNPQELGQQYRELRRRLPQLSVLGGCCGTDHRHIVAICDACAPAQ